MEKAVVLLSGGLDSTVNLYKAVQNLEVNLCLTFDYGQKSAKKEILAAQSFCEELKLKHQILELNFFKYFTNTSLINHSSTIPRDVSLDDSNSTIQSAKAVWVPNRNGIFLNIAAGFAEGLCANFVVPGFNVEEAQTFPDNTQEFLLKINHSFAYSTSNCVKTLCYTTQLNKKQIAQLGLELGVNFNNIWPCYHGYEKICRTCESCLRFLRATKGIFE